MRYKFITYWGKADESFIVEVFELPGCMAGSGCPQVRNGGEVYAAA